MIKEVLTSPLAMMIYLEVAVFIIAKLDKSNKIVAFLTRLLNKLTS